MNYLLSVRFRSIEPQTPLMEVVQDGGGRLSVVLAGHPKLRNDLRRPTMEEIGYRTDVFTLDGIAGSQREYIQWLLKTCMCSGSHLKSGRLAFISFFGPH